MDIDVALRMSTHLAMSRLGKLATAQPSSGPAAAARTRITTLFCLGSAALLGSCSSQDNTSKVLALCRKYPVVKVIDRAHWDKLLKVDQKTRFAEQPTYDLKTERIRQFESKEIPRLIVVDMAGYNQGVKLVEIRNLLYSPDSALSGIAYPSMVQVNCIRVRNDELATLLYG